MLAGTATIPVVYFLGKEVVNEKVGLVAALLLAVAPYHIYYSQEARMYTFTTLFVTLAYYLFFKARSDNKYYIWMWLSCVAAFYTHFYTGFIIIPLILGYYLLNRKDTNIKFVGVIPAGFKEFILGGIFAFVLVLPILSSFLNQSAYLGGRTYGWGLQAGVIPFATLQSFSFQTEIVSVVFLLLVILGMWLVYKKERMLSIVVALFLAIPLLISMLMSSYIPFNTRYHIYLLPLFLVVVSVGIERFTRIWDNRNATYAAVFLILVCAVVTLPPYYSQYSRDNWRGFSDGLRSATNIGDTVVVVPSYMQLPLNYYYSNTTDVTILLGANSVADLQNITSDHRILYVVTGDINAQDPGGNSVRWLQENTQPVGQFTGIYLLVKEAP
jgi:uncharacterized membrane protein